MKVNANDGFDEEGPFSPWVPPDDRLWRHPSENLTSVVPGPYGTPRGSRSMAPRTWTTALIAGIVGALLASGIGVATGTFDRTTVVHNYNALTSSTTKAAPVQRANPSGWTAVNDDLAPAMVMISGSGDAGQVDTSGMLWKEGTWGTAYVLAASENLGGVTSVKVAFAGGQTARGRVVGSDLQTGIAVIEVPENALPAGMFENFPDLEPLTDVHVGDELAAVGSQGETGGSFETGSVSSLDRPVTDSTNGLVLLGMIAVATTGPVNYGTAVVGTTGAVVGLTVEGGSTDGDTSLVSYAVPMDVASDIAAEIVEGQQPWHPWIGVLQAEDLLPKTASEMHLTGGAEIDAISPGSPAAKAGLSPSDVIVSLANTPVNSTGGLLDALSLCSNASRVSLRYLHQGKPVNTSIEVIAQPMNP